MPTARYPRVATCADPHRPSEQIPTAGDQRRRWGVLLVPNTQCGPQRGAVDDRELPLLFTPTVTSRPRCRHITSESRTRRPPPAALTSRSTRAVSVARGPTGQVAVCSPSRTAVCDRPAATATSPQRGPVASARFDRNRRRPASDERLLAGIAVVVFECRGATDQR